jgi:hypothetical protein
VKIYQKITNFFLLCWVAFFLQQLISRGSWIFNKTEDQIVWLVLLTLLYVPGRIYKSIKRLPFTSYDYKWIGLVVVFIISTNLWLWYEDSEKVPYAISSDRGAFVNIEDIVAIESFRENSRYKTDNKLTLTLTNGDKVEIWGPHFVSKKRSRLTFNITYLQKLLED